MTHQSQPAKSLDIFSTCPQSKDFPAYDYARHAIDVARWSEAAGCTGILIYADNGLVDPWMMAETIIQNTERLCPLVAVQPVYMHPYSAAKMVASLAFLYGRRIYLNMIAGGFRPDLQALNDPTPHDERYERLTEYTLVIKGLLASPTPITFEGRYYTVHNLRMAPAMPTDLMPGILMSGSSEASLASVDATGAVGIVYPKPAEEQMDAASATSPRGVRIGIIARASSAEAWRIAHARFPEDRKGQLTHKLTMAVSDSVWHKQLSAVKTDAAGNGPYWLWPFQTYKTFCPYFVGSFDEVAEQVSRYVSKGYRTYILDIPASPEDLNCARIVFDRAVEISEYASA